MRAALDDAGKRDGAGRFGQLGEFIDRGGGAPVVGAAGIDANQDGALAGRMGGMFGSASAANERLRIRDTAVRCAVGMRRGLSADAHRRFQIPLAPV